MPARALAFLLLLAALLAGSGCQTTSNEAKPENLSSEEVQQRRQQINDMATRAMERFYEEHPDARKEVESAAGYGVFDVSSVNVVLVVGARGKGVIFDNKTNAPTYMRTARAGTGPGVGYQKLYQIFIFKSEQALSQFRLGGTGGGDVGASATAGSANAQLSFNPNITVYEIKEKGFAVQANWGGTAYLVDPDLN
jgi:lipid-binding SYLF domain-containing protein